MKTFAKIIVFSFFLYPVLIEGKDTKELCSDHFVIVSDKSVSQDYVYEIKDMAEYFYKTITQEFNFIRDNPWLWKNRTKIFVAKDRDDYLKKYNCPQWSSACVDYQGKQVFTYAQQKNFSSILSHELTHIIFREYMGKTQLPLWLDEGMSVYMERKYEKKPNKDFFALLKKILKENRYIKLDELSNITLSELKAKPKEYVDMFYMESFSVVYFLINKWSAYSLRNFLKFIKEGYNVREALCKSYNIRTINELEKRWIKFYQK